MFSTATVINTMFKNHFSYNIKTSMAGCIIEYRRIKWLTSSSSAPHNGQHDSTPPPLYLLFVACKTYIQVKHFRFARLTEVMSVSTDAQAWWTWFYLHSLMFKKLNYGIYSLAFDTRSSNHFSQTTILLFFSLHFFFTWNIIQEFQSWWEIILH